MTVRDDTCRLCGTIRDTLYAVERKDGKTIQPLCKRCADDYRDGLPEYEDD
jgi:hypothetical protein